MLLKTYYSIVRLLGKSAILFFLIQSNGFSQRSHLDSSIVSFMVERYIPGFAACKIENDRIIWSKTFGQANVEKRIPMSIDGIMNIGSISKTFTATAIMQLWEKGKVKLEADVNDYIGFTVRNPKFPDKPITVFQLLTHTSSILDGKAYGESYSCGDPTTNLHDWIYGNLNNKGKFFGSGDNFHDFAPGEKEEYSNVAFGLLGLIVEKVSKQPFNIYCRDFIFRPLGMIKTGWMLNEVDISKYIIPYAFVTKENRNELLENKELFSAESEFKVGSFVPYCLYSFPNYPDGLIRTSIRELSYFLRAMINGGKLNDVKILNETTISKMLTLQIDGNKHRGLCWEKFENIVAKETISLWGHSGGDPGITTYLLFNPIDKTGVIAFQNNATGGTEDIVKKIYLEAK
ncbi:serine hydrolase domain-containing protein [Emticicia agri]|uniref:Class C beta-lactamase-related serine hydrolase n=1 Tax=Emticicia agri TaxID=2492393 RepID=A0A4Q5LT92_9BACT|nr:serine hydrolase [Emticicia agri]RYU92649.1 class C beta-lactamase-related serine hydrolase [Emticicia agri]